MKINPRPTNVTVEFTGILGDFSSGDFADRFSIAIIESLAELQRESETDIEINNIKIKVADGTNNR